ncbi:MAG: quinoprotein dehydrogenase-associated putative ABC transporter substrate-binding protein [Methylococcales bacterium]|nr:MAG: quinoprotein dehydrogenase-associated putative ABC transporter substrate-binding protein [Methylococcales bacterium]
MSVTKILAGLCLAAAILPVTAAEKFKVCADPLNPPYSTKDEQGFENKIAELFAKELGQKVEYTWFAQRIGFIRNTLTADVNEWNAGKDEFKCDIVMGVPAGYDLTTTTAPYYKSTYVLLIAKGRGWDDIKDPDQLPELPLQKQESLKIAMFDRGPSAAWLQQNGLLDQGISYQSMSGDSENNVAMQIDKDFKAKKIDMVILWGPMAAYVMSQSPKNSYTLLPMKSTPAIKFDFAMAIGVRKGDKEKKQLLDNLIVSQADKIKAIIERYNIPLLPMTQEATKEAAKDKK